MQFHTVTEDQIKDFVKGVQAISDNHYKTRFPTLTPSKIEYELGNRYCKIIKAEFGGGRDGARSVYGFIDMTNGDVLKAAGWKAPAKNFARGNLNDEAKGLGRCREYSVS